MGYDDHVKEFLKIAPPLDEATAQEIKKRMVEKRRNVKDTHERAGITIEKIRRIKKGMVMPIPPQFPGDVARFHHIRNRTDYEQYVNAMAVEPDFCDLDRVHQYFMKNIKVLARRINYDDESIEILVMQMALEAADDLHMCAYTAFRATQFLFNTAIIPQCGKFDCSVREKNIALFKERMNKPVPEIKIIKAGDRPDYVALFGSIECMSCGSSVSDVFIPDDTTKLAWHETRKCPYCGADIKHKITTASYEKIHTKQELAALMRSLNK